MWTIGEFADLLNIPYVDEDAISVNEVNEVEQPLNVSEDKVIEICEEVLANNLMNLVTKEYTIEALMKLSVRFPNHAPHIKKLLDFYCCHMSIELQQRSVEFCTLFTKYSNLRPSLLEKMPPLPKLNKKERDSDKGSDSQSMTNGDLLNEISDNQSNAKVNTNENKSSSALLDLLGDSIGDLDNSLTTKNTTSLENNKNATVNGNNILDLLGDLDLNPTTNSNNLIMNDNDNKLINNLNSTNQLNIFDSNEIKLNNSNNQSTKATSSILNDDLFSDIRNLDQTSNSNSINDKTFNKITAVEKDGLKIEFSFEKNKDPNTPITIHLEATNQNSSNISNFLFQAAVPKVIKIVKF